MSTESTGEKLKTIRQELGFSLEEAQKKTKIHLSILKAIEGDSLTGLNPVYLKGFLKIYCKFLGLDPKDYIEGYKEQIQVKKADTAKAVTVGPKKSETLLKTALAKLSALRPSKKVIKVFVLILAAILLMRGLFNLGKFISSKHRHNLANKKVSQGIPKPVPAKPLKALPSGILLGIKARENCWVNLKVDGKLVFQRILEKGRFESWQAKEKIELSLGNVGAVELQVNGQLFSSLGRRGQPLKNILITKEGLKIP